MRSGLGLSICKGIVEAHGGRIWAESEGMGRGSRFTFTLAVAEGTWSSAISPAAPRGRRQQEQGRILVVDDDPMTLRYVRDILAKAGFTPVVTGDPEEALTLFGAERPRLALLDLALPEGDGIDLMGKMLRIAEVPVVFLSAYSRDEIIVRALEAGAVDYIVKPFSSNELVARVRSALRRRLAPLPVEAPEPFILGDLVLDYAERAVSVAGRPVSLTPTEYDLLCELSLHAGRVLTFNHLLERVWGLDRSVDRSAVRTYVKRLRGKLGEHAVNPKHIFSEPRVGYRMGKAEMPGISEQ